MATKKLKVELELETAKAKRQAKEFEQTAGSGGGSSSAQSGKKLAESLDKAARSAEKSAGTFDKMSGTSARLTRGFAGIAVGMATSYAANYATGGTKTALEYGGAGISGAVGGAMMAGLPGAIVGGLAGVLKTYMEKDAEKSAMSKDFETGEAIYAATRRDQLKFDGLSTMKPGTDIAANLKEVKKLIDNYGESAAGFVEAIRNELKKADPDKEKIATLKRNLDYSRAQISKYEGLTKSLESMQDAVNHDRGGFSAADSLSKLGIAFGEGFAVPGDSPQAQSSKPKALSSGFGFGFSVPVTPSVTHEFSAAAEGLVDPVDKIVDERLKQINEDQLKVLQDIAANTKERGFTWQ